MDAIVFGNTLWKWAIALGITSLVTGALYVVRAYIYRHLLALSQRTRTRIDDLAVHTLRATYAIFIVAIAIYLGSLALDLPVQYSLILSRVAILALLVQAGLWLDSGIRSWRTIYRRERPDPAQAAATTSMTTLCFVARLLLWVVIALMVLDNLGVNITTLVASLGIGGIAVALAMQNILGDLFASLSIILDKPFVVGDFIIVGDALGTVEFIGIKTTRLRGLGGDQIIFSNADLLKSRIQNQQRMQTRRAAFIIRVVYHSGNEQLRAIPDLVRAIITAQPNALFERAHFFRYSDWSLDFEVVYHIQNADYFLYMDIQQAIYLELHRRFAAAGIEFAFPTQVLRVPDDTANLREGERRHFG